MPCVFPQLQQAQKFEAIGTLAGGIAHDFNNLLMGIQGRTALMAADIGPFHPVSEHLAAIEEYIQSAADLTRQLLGFARAGKYEVRPIEINKLVSESASLFGRTKKEIRIQTQLEEPSPVVAVDHRQIEQVLLNMYVNAWQAMSGGGTLYLETSMAEMDAELCRPHHVGDGIDLVILDLVMPGMDGGKLFDRIREMNPDLPVMLSSGYSINGHAADIMKRGCNGFIQKPFTITELSRMVRRVLDDAKSGSRKGRRPENFPAAAPRQDPS